MGHSYARTALARIPLAGHAILALVLLISLVLNASGWFTADEVVMHQQSEALAAGSWTVSANPDADAIDPDRDFLLLARSGRTELGVAPYVRHPAAPVVVAAAEWTLGPRWRLLPGAVAAVVASILLAAEFGRSRIVFWLPFLSTTLLFHVTVLWAHSIAFLLATLAALALRALLEVERFEGWSVVKIVLFLSGVSLVRTEGLLLSAAVALAVFLYSQRRSLVARAVPAALILGAAAAVYVGEPLLRKVLLGTEANVANIPVAGSLNPIASRISLLRLMFFEPSLGGSVVERLRLVGLLALIAGGVLAVRMPRHLSAVRILSAVAALAYLTAVAGSPAPGLLVAMPLLAAALPWVRLESDRDRACAVVAIVFAALVVGTSYDNAGGGDWGARYLFIGVPFLLLIVVPALRRMLVNRASRSVLIAAIVCAAAIQSGVLLDFLNRDETVATVDSTIRSVRGEVMAYPDAVVAVSDERLSRFLYDRGLRGGSFHVPSDKESEFHVLLGHADVTHVIWVDLGSAGDGRDGEPRETHGSVSIRTVVRR